MDFPGTSENQKDIECLHSAGIQLWSTSQESLEKQALEELEILHATVDVSSSEVITDAIGTSNGNLLPVDKNDNEKEYEEEEEEEEEHSNHSDSDYIPSEEERSSKRSKLCKKNIKKSQKCKVSKILDDALEPNYKARLDSYYKRLEDELKILGNSDQIKKDFRTLKGGLKVPKDVWSCLYEYQKEGVYWLWELHQHSKGGVLGDEMGLGKTVQIIVFLRALQYTRHVSRFCNYTGVGPTIVVCPATVIVQWVQHFHQWAPEFRVAVLHQSGTHRGHNKVKFIQEMFETKTIIVTTYAAVLKYQSALADHCWHYLILDEGHKIRNPNAKITGAVKAIRTPHKLMLTGSPMQNNLTELWSLFDFSNPGMLGDLTTFTEHFANPILQGGFANSTAMQEATALSVASTLKNVISPFMLRRMKSDVQEHIRLPYKSEQVLFCSLTDEQRAIYKDYLMSEPVNNVLGRGVRGFRSDNFLKGSMLTALTSLRKICNHPDLFIYDGADSVTEEEHFGSYKKSGKMIVVSALLKIWKKQGHRTLLFSQGRLMLHIFELFLKRQGYSYLKMDGSTCVSSRQTLIDRFNSDSSVDIFLLTTKVGGLGINLTGADRVIIYDPDWNPATDAQARERAWRIGQNKSVTVYRLLSAGTVEEKMYQRQVWKQLLSNKVLIDPTTGKFFKSSDLFDLFSLPETVETNPESTNIFREARVKMQEKIEEREKQKNPGFSSDKIEAMKSLAKQIAKSLSNVPPVKSNNAYHLELQEEREEKLKRREQLKKLTPQQLIEYNRLKAAQEDDTLPNKLDDKETDGSFETALARSAKTATLYRKLTSGQIKRADLEKLKAKTGQSKEEPSTSGKRKREESLDKSGKIDGEQVEGLVKREVKKRPKLSKESQDDYILEHLFMKKGVSGALEHESVVNRGTKPQSLKVQSCAEEKALKALEAIKKTKLKNWHW